MDTTTSTHSFTFYDFLDRMRNPASLDLVRSIKSFIVSFSFSTTNPENDGRRLQDFILTMEDAIRNHSLWAGASEEEIDCAIEGLEKYVMTKLFSRTFASSSDDAKFDQEISEKICLLQYFLRPEHLDIPEVFHNEASWLLAEKELQKINAFKAPRKLSLANPPQLHSNLKYIQLYRRQAKLVSEAAYYFTNLVSAKSFIFGLEAKSVSIDEIEFQESMKTARLAITRSQIVSPPVLDETAASPVSSTRMHNKTTQHEASSSVDKIGDSSVQTDSMPSRGMQQGRIANVNGGSCYPFMEAKAGELTIADVEELLSLYKDVVKKYTSLCGAFRHLAISKKVPSDSRVKGANVQQEQPEEQINEGHKLGE